MRNSKGFRFWRTYSQLPKTQPPWPTLMYSPIHYFGRLTAHTTCLNISSLRIRIRTLDISDREQKCQTCQNTFSYVCSSLRSSQISKHIEATERILTDFTHDELLGFPLSACWYFPVMSPYIFVYLIHGRLRGPRNLANNIFKFYIILKHVTSIGKKKKSLIFGAMAFCFFEENGRLEATCKKYNHQFDVCVTVHRWYNNINSQLDATITNFIDNFNQLNMFRAIISPILRNNRLCLQLVV